MKITKAEAMFAKVDQWQQSGKSLREYAELIGMSKSSLGYWAHKKRTSHKRNTSFVEMIPDKKSMEMIRVSSAPLAEDTTRASMVVTFPGGMTVNIYG